MQIGFIDTPYKFLSNVGSTRGLVAFMNCLMWFGNTTILLMAGMMGIDTSLFEAAEVDRATSMQVFFKITLPLLRPDPCICTCNFFDRWSPAVRCAADFDKRNRRSDAFLHDADHVLE